MALYERILGISGQKIPVHQLMALLAERVRNRVTNADVIAALGLDSAEQAELLTLWGRVQGGQLTPAEFQDVAMLAEMGLVYDTVAKLTARLGV